MKTTTVFKTASIGPWWLWLIAQRHEPKKLVGADFDEFVLRGAFSRQPVREAPRVLNFDSAAKQGQDLVRKRIVNEGFPDVVNLRAIIDCRRNRNEDSSDRS